MTQDTPRPLLPQHKRYDFIPLPEREDYSWPQGKRLALATLDGATELAARSDEPPSVLRERVTSKGGTTHAALQSLQADGVAPAFVKALKAAQQRAAALGDEFG